MTVGTSTWESWPIGGKDKDWITAERMKMRKAMSKVFRLEECRMAMETVMSCLQTTYDLAEIYSPPGMVKEANGVGMRSGFSSI